MIDTAAAKARLDAMLVELTARRQRLDTDLAEPADPDWSERAVQQEDDAALEGQAALVEQEIASVTRALDRIAEGTYGECVSCGGPISAGRLEARPEAALCIDCANRS
jgi:DnaK suppressor protein